MGGVGKCVFVRVCVCVRMCVCGGGCLRLHGNQIDAIDKTDGYNRKEMEFLLLADIAC